MNLCKFVDVISFAHFIRVLEDCGYSFRTNINTEPFEIIVEFWKKDEVI